jgi:cell division septation protein DedD
MNVKALTIADSFNLRVASFRSAAAAADLAAQLEAVGLPAFVRVERGTLHQVVVGPYLSHAEITGVQSRLAAFGHPDSDVFVEYYEPATADAGADDRGGRMAFSEASSR